MPKFDDDTIKSLLSTPCVEIPQVTRPLKEIREALEKYRGFKLDNAYATIDIMRPNCKGEPIKTVKQYFKSTSIGTAWGIVFDEKDSTLVVRNTGHDPITLYNLEGNKLKSLGSNIPGIATQDFQGITIDT